MAPIIIFAVIGCILQAVFIAVEHKEKYVGAVILKGSASVMFIIVGFLSWKLSQTTFFDLGGGNFLEINKVAQPENFAKLVLIGLILGGVGDVLLNLRFVFEKIGQKIFLAGIAAFLAGHILYLAALIPLSESLWLCIIIGAVIAACVLAYIFKTMEVKTSFKIFGIFYLGAVIIMTAIAVGNLIAAPAALTWFYAVGAVLFTVSDIVLIFNTFSGTTRFSLRITNLSLYYLGQLLIASSLMFA